MTVIQLPRNSKAHYRVYVSPTLGPVLSKTNRVHTYSFTANGLHK